MPLPTVGEFKGLTGRSGLAKLAKTKNDLGPIMNALEAQHRTQPNSVAEIASARALRSACLTWLSDLSNTQRLRISHDHVRQLMEQADERFRRANEAHPRSGVSGHAPLPARPIPQVPRLPVLSRVGSGDPLPRIGNAMHARYQDELQDRHWGPNVHHRMTTFHTRYRQAGGTLAIGDWADQIYLPNSQDDPTGAFLGLGYAADPQTVAQGVHYCTADQRRAYRITVRDGLLYGGEPSEPATQRRFDTRGLQTGVSGFGWAIFVLGLDNELYAHSHVPNRFHHSSFFAGGPVQCGGELCAVDGQLHFLTNKTGHYRSGQRELYRMLHFLTYGGVDLGTVLACRDTTAQSWQWHRASAVFHDNREAPLPVVHAGRPDRLEQAGVPAF